MTMKLATLALSAFALSATAFATRAQAEEATPLALGASLPMTTAKLKNSIDGKLVSLADVKGTKGTLVVFTCNNCPFAKAWEERIVGLANESSKKGIGSMLVNSNTSSKSETIPAMQERAKERGMQVPYAVDEKAKLAKAFGASVTPEAYLFDKSGKLVYHGTIDDDHKQADQVKKHYLKDALDAVVGGKAPPLAETKSIGCGIKFGRDS
jgi:peroxiredoxin